MTSHAFRCCFQHSDEHGLDVVAFRIVYESSVIGRAVVRARAGFAVTGVAIGKASIIERLHCVIVGGLERHMNRGDGIALGSGAHPHSGTILGHKSLNARESRALAVAH